MMPAMHANDVTPAMHANDVMCVSLASHCARPRHHIVRVPGITLCTSLVSHHAHPQCHIVRIACVPGITSCASCASLASHHVTLCMSHLTHHIVCDVMPALLASHCARRLRHIICIMSCASRASQASHRVCHGHLASCTCGEMARKNERPGNFSAPEK